MLENTRGKGHFLLMVWRFLLGGKSNCLKAKACRFIHVSWAKVSTAGLGSSRS